MTRIFDQLRNSAPCTIRLKALMQSPQRQGKYRNSVPGDEMSNICVKFRQDINIRSTGRIPRY